MSLRNDILSWDGKSGHDITLVYERYNASHNFINELIEHCRVFELQKDATWLIKKYCENGGKLTENQILKVLSSLSKYKHWETELHILQIMPYFPIPMSVKKEVEFFLMSYLEQNQKFVRAWSYNGFYELARQYPEYQEEVKQFFEMALRDESASVKARIRNILKNGF